MFDPRDVELPETSMYTPLQVFVDATIRENGLSVGACVFCNHNKRPLHRVSQPIGTNMESVEAETETLRRAIKGLGNIEGVRHARVYTDCEEASKRVDSSSLGADLDSLSVEWIPREENWVADTVAARAAH